MKPMNSSEKPMLSDTLSVILPTAEQTWLLRACLHRGEAGCKAWQVWQEQVGNSKKALAEGRQGSKWLLPLLYRALQRNGAVVDRDLLPYLRTSYFREKLRSQTFRRICQNVLAPLTTAEIPLIVLNGAALADTVYGDWALRHCGTLDFLVKQEDLLRAVSVLRADGPSLAAKDLDSRARSVRFEHTSALPIHLHCGLFRIPYYQTPLAGIRERSVASEIVGVPVRILSPADMLLHVCGHASCSRGRETLRWVCDAWSIIKECADLDWDVLVDSALHSRLALPLSVMFSYLTEELGAPIPSFVPHRLTAAAAQMPLIGCEAALTGARMGVDGTFNNLLRQTDSWRAWAVVLKWMLLPSPSCLRWTYTIRSSWLLPFYYVYRPLRYLARHIWFAVKLR